MKYIVVAHEGLELPILFPNVITHIKMWSLVKVGNDTVVSAGFVRQVLDGEIRAHGESESIGIKSRPQEDSELITKFLKRG